MKQCNLLLIAICALLIPAIVSTAYADQSTPVLSSHANPDGKSGITSGGTSSNWLTLLFQDIRTQEAAHELISSQSILSAFYLQTESTSSISKIRHMRCVDDFTTDEVSKYVSTRYWVYDSDQTFHTALTKLIMSGEHAGRHICEQMGNSALQDREVLALGDKEIEIAEHLIGVETDIEDNQAEELVQPGMGNPTSWIVSEIDSAQEFIDHLGQ